MNRRTVNEKLEDESIKQSVYLIRYSNGEARKVARMLNKITPAFILDLQKELLDLPKSKTAKYTPRKRRAIKNLKLKLEDRLQGVKFLGRLVDDLEKLALTQAQTQVNIFNSSTPEELGIVFNRPAQQTLKSLVTSQPFNGEILKDHITWHKTSTTRKVMREIKIGMVRGLSMEQTSERVRSQLNISVRNAQAITRTATNHVSTQAREATYAENKNVVKKVKYVATLDSRTTDTCQSLDQKVFPINEGSRPPMHFQCRSTTVPVLMSWEELGISATELKPSTRASMNGQVPENQSYDGWLRNQSVSTQKEVLGTPKYEAFKKGAHVDRFVDDQNNSLSLKELRERGRIN